jgi:CxxC motif-containing protein (DUF1111 family)
MPRIRLRLPAFSGRRHSSAIPPPGGRLFGLVFAFTGLALVGLASAPLLAGAQSTENRVPVQDPGVRGGPPGAGGPVSGLTSNEQAVFNSSQTTFNEVDSVLGTLPATGAGLGPGFNMDSCAGCHAQPAVGGSSPPTNPQIAVAHKANASNPVDLSAIISINGPVREVRFKRNADGTPDGGVHDLFTIAGRSDASGCTTQQPNFSAALSQGNAIFRIPTPTFGAGLIESIPDATILANKTAFSDRKAGLGISGHENREGNTGTITRFGWKAQNKSLLLFAGEAYNVEQGVTNDLFPNERDGTPDCQYNGIPEDHMNFDTGEPADIVQFANFMRMLAPPTPSQGFVPTGLSAGRGGSIADGQQQFNQAGCGMCHTPQLTTGQSSAPTSLSNVPVNLYSDLLVHNMGAGLADGISQGNAGPDEFRSAPLWGVGQRIFFLHDGRTSDLLQAIEDHAGSGSEANTVISNFNALTPTQRQDVLYFLRSL